MHDTIAAIATGGALAAIGIVRVSGNGAITAAQNVFRAAGGIKLIDAEDRHMYYGELVARSGATLDMGLCFISRSPGSYTGQDTVELHCHGSPVVLSGVLNALFAVGVRQALPGEFTKRAFLNGRMDLTQAEAVIDIIEAETMQAAQNAAGQLRGAVGARLSTVYSSLLDIMAHFHAVIDYPDEDIYEFEMQNHLSSLRSAEQELSKMLKTHDRGKVLREGVPTVIAGRPNTGKSSLLNALLGYERAIVADMPGTTRDTIEEKVIICGQMLRIIDTAGLRESSDAVEQIGVNRTREAISRAKIAMIVLDGSEPLKKEDLEVFGTIPHDMPKLAVINKSDLRHVLDASELKGLAYCRVSALTGSGLDILEAEIKKLLDGPLEPHDGQIITNDRQAEAIMRSRDSVIRSIDAILESNTPDAVLTDVEAALTAIGEITGATMRDDITSRIFDRFCVGK